MVDIQKNENSYFSLFCLMLYLYLISVGTNECLLQPPPPPINSVKALKETYSTNNNQ